MRAGSQTPPRLRFLFVMSTSSHWQKHLTMAEGYFELGMIEDATSELNQIPTRSQSEVEVSSLRLQLLIASGNYERGECVARGLVFKQPEKAFPWLGWAFCARRAISLEAAEQILEMAHTVHPKNGIIVFNMACYASAAGRISDARQLFSRATQLESAAKEWIRNDESLSAIHAAEE
jgi:Flp pilus assembly protein TadD